MSWMGQNECAVRMNRKKAKSSWKNMEIVQFQTNINMERKLFVLQMDKWRETLKISVSWGKIIIFLFLQEPTRSKSHSDISLFL
jgi:hypothetical protein